MRKQLTYFILTLMLLLNMFPTAFADSPNTASLPATEINATTTWSYLDDNTDPAGDSTAVDYNRTSWTAANFNDSGWKTAVGSFGAKNNAKHTNAANKLEGCFGSRGNNYTTYFFRTHVTIPEASAVTAMKGTLLYDDSVIVYINSVPVFSGRAENITSNMQYSDNSGESTNTLTITDKSALNALQDGDNVVAVELHNTDATSSDILFDLSMEFSTEPVNRNTSLITDTTQWSYLDDNTDPANGAADRTVWTAESFDVSQWKTAAGPFGSKKGNAALETGYTAETVLSGCDGVNNTPAYFLRTTFNIDSLEGMTKLIGILQYDDGVIIYINGQRVAAFDDNACDATGSSLRHGFDANLQYGGSNGGTPAKVSFQLTDFSILHTGTNTIAVELHNGRQTSSDVWFQMSDLHLSDETIETIQSDISLVMGADKSQMNLTWYASVDGEGTLKVAKQSELVDGKMPADAKSYAVTGGTVNKEGYYNYQATMTGLKPATAYAYQMINQDKQSAIHTFTTGGSDAFTFAYVGDPQIGASGNGTKDANGWDKTLNIIDKNSIFNDTSFLLSAGDQVNTANDEEQYDGYLNHDALLSLPMATVIGNHDSKSNAYDQHFNVANESTTQGKTTAGGNNWFVYNKVLFMVLNSNNKSCAEHEAFMKEAIEATKNQNIQWKIVAYHHSIFTVANHSTDSYITDPTGFKNTMAPILKNLDIDVVLQGHDHVYCRTYMMDGLIPITESDKYEYGNGKDQAPTAVNDSKGILYVTANSGSGSKTYNIKTEVDFPFSAVQNQEHVANVSKVEISDKQFKITTYRTTDMSVVDSFAIKRHTKDSGNTDDSKKSGNAGYFSNRSNTRQTITNADRPVTTTVSDKTTGTVVTTTKYKDGSSVVAETKKDGTVTITETAVSGVKLKTVQKPGEDVTAKVTVPSNIHVATVTVPGKMSYGDVAVNAKTGEIIKISVPTANGMQVKVDGSTELIIKKNSKTFSDAENHWAADAINFVSAHELFNGTSATTFTADGTMTRAMLMMVLARFDGEDTNGGSKWYEKGENWAKIKGISDGSNPQSPVTREQLASMLYRFAGSPDITGSLNEFPDGSSVSSYAVNAMNWAVHTGLVLGMSNGTLDPQGNTTRAQVATILMRFCTKLIQ